MHNYHHYCPLSESGHSSLKRRFIEINAPIGTRPAGSSPGFLCYHDCPFHMHDSLKGNNNNSHLLGKVALVL